MLIVWGEHDQIFPAAGAEPYKRDLKNVEFHLLDAGHFISESNGDEIAQLMREFLVKHLQPESKPLPPPRSPIWRARWFALTPGLTPDLSRRSVHLKQSREELCCPQSGAKSSAPVLASASVPQHL